jgi:NAD+ diphosphatase
MRFIADLKPPATEPKPALWFVFQNEKMMVKINEGAFRIPRTPDLKELASTLSRKQYLGSLDGHPCHAAELSGDSPVPAGFACKVLRELFGEIDEDLIWVAGRANQLVHWSRTHRYCGGCGMPTVDKTDERAKICPRCGLINYPRLSPAIIVAVIRENRLLLAHSKRFKTGFYSVLAGFVEPGETLEDCVKREVHEEVGIALKNIHYFGSQPWPFPDSLMVAFTAEYAGGEIKANESEIVDAGWFSSSKLPQVPPKISIARQLIDWFRANY